MTVVAANVANNQAFIGADCLASDDELAALSASPKVAQFGTLLLGFAGSWRVGQQFFRTAQNALNPRLEQLLDKVEPDVKDDWQLLAVEGGRIYEVTADKGIIEARKTRGGAYGAIGSGASVALGSLYGRHQDEPDLMVALEAAQEHIVNVRGPFTILSVEWK